MIDRLRRDLQTQLEHLLGEADKIRKALTALGGSHDGDSNATSPKPSAPKAEAQPARRRAGTQTRSSRTRATRSTTKTTRQTTTGRAASGATKSAVLAALAGGEAMTASQVANATGLGRATVSTTLSKLAKSGEVSKAQRGYKLAQPAGAAS